jgi:hydroxymethylpyrimidine pyrophosphatase-like HAD family hydrolase
MLQWAAKKGRAVAMGQAPEEVRIHATDITDDFLGDGVAKALNSLSA